VEQLGSIAGGCGVCVVHADLEALLHIWWSFVCHDGDGWFWCAFTFVPGKRLRQLVVNCLKRWWTSEVTS
jgi:hypothetical protein